MKEKILESTEFHDAKGPISYLSADGNAPPQGTGPQREHQKALDIRSLEFYKSIFRLDGAKYALKGLSTATVAAGAQPKMSVQKPEEEAKPNQGHNNEYHHQEQLLTSAMSVAHAEASLRFAIVRKHAVSIKHCMDAIKLYPTAEAYNEFIELSYNAKRLGPPTTHRSTATYLALEFKEATEILKLCNGHWGIAMLAPFSYDDGPLEVGPVPEASELNGDGDMTRQFADYYKRKESTLNAICLLGKAIMDEVIAGGPISKVLEITRKKLGEDQQLDRETMSRALHPWFGRECKCKPYIE
ncbi:unnamed protein product [Clonostachys rosea f. rosea IK726]|jgi:hypothetical protein|uniref:Uncharacterized protein n=10 Tax=Clonostachys rosea f. rosea IK726 TaxID=1349383 RepID=A0ACA9UDP5_BIOOC|nr:unnamed protein product [Clonostachys rosea f. rosea IK726]CAG9951485.1 unnamed protein product [Clonostachys rosea f. rosea IK726]CAG9951488.1 unnamed protein product [Clonostachys rosea f. rosea IK726]CAG9951851.1 unnamed protein product [Clonostachys rosea f. rosea IK726]CAG9951854.1 unnamed protein product [Clonostachys rosea f. rosea IK726]